MLCQLVCLDRRYQRMNCFNIREVQALLKGRFFNDLVNSNDHHDFLNKTIIGLRFKTNDLNSINPNMLLFYRYGLYNNTSRSQSYINSVSTENGYMFFSNNSFFTAMINNLSSSLSSPIINSFYRLYFVVLESFTLGTPSFNVNTSGKSTVFSVLHSLISYIKIQFETFSNSILNLFNFNEPM